MADNLADLNDEQQAKALAWVDAHWPLPRACPFHPGGTTWEINTHVGMMAGYNIDGSGFANYAFPAIVVTCGVCGFMVPLSAIKMGVVQPLPTPEPDRPEATPAEVG